MMEHAGIKAEYHFKDIVQYYSPNFYWGAWESFCKTRDQFMSTIFHCEFIAILLVCILKHNAQILEYSCCSLFKRK